MHFLGKSYHIFISPINEKQIPVRHQPPNTDICDKKYSSNVASLTNGSSCPQTWLIVFNFYCDFIYIESKSLTISNADYATHRTARDSKVCQWGIILSFVSKNVFESKSYKKLCLHWHHCKQSHSYKIQMILLENFIEPGWPIGGKSLS